MEKAMQEAITRLKISVGLGIGFLGLAALLNYIGNKQEQNLPLSIPHYEFTPDKVEMVLEQYDLDGNKNNLNREELSNLLEDYQPKRE